MSTCEHTCLEPIEVPEARRLTVTGAGDLPIAAFEYGDGGPGRPLLFIHGFMQSHLCWYEQLVDPAVLAGRRVAALDLRGHGESGRALPDPPGPGLPAGHAPADFADDVVAVIDALELDEPVLVGWSYGGLVIADVVRTHGTGRLGGAVFAGAACRLDPPAQLDAFIGPGFHRVAEDLFSPELQALVRGTHGFLDACFHRPLAPSQFAFQLACNMHVPAANRLALLARGPERFDEEVLPAFDRPALVIHGAQDEVILPESGAAIAAAIPGARAIVYEDCGHAPFLEHPARFNRDLLGFLAG